MVKSTKEQSLKAEAFAKECTSSFLRKKSYNYSVEFLKEAQAFLDTKKEEWAKKTLPQQLDYINENLDFVIIGLPGGATTFTSNLLTKCNLNTGHEAVFNQGGEIRWQEIWASGLKGECSGFAYPFRNLLPDVVFYTIIRDPLLVVNSLVQIHKHTPLQAFQAVTQVYSNKANIFRVENIVDLVQILTKWPRQSIISKMALMEKKDRNVRQTPIKITEDDLPRAVKELRDFWGYV